MKIQARDKLVLIGDSITDCGRARPVGEGHGLGTGYVALVDALLATGDPLRRIRVVNMGCSGNTVRDLAQRWATDVLELKPDWLSIMIGINDVWRQFDCPTRPETHVLPDEFERTLADLVRQTQPLVKGLVMLTPYYIEPRRDDAMRVRMDQYAAIVREIAQRSGAVWVDTQAVFDNLLRGYYPAAIAWDRVHPNLTGHLALAQALLKALEA